MSQLTQGGIPVTKKFLRARQMSDPEKAERTVTEMVSDWSQLQIQTFLGDKFRRTQRIRLERPRWMPRRLYLRLLRSIVVDWLPEERS